MVPLPPQTKGKRGAQKKSTLSWRKTHVKSVVQWNIQTKEVLQEARCFHPVTSFECNLWSFFLQLSCIKQNGFAFQLSGGSFADCFREGPGTFFWQKTNNTMLEVTIPSIEHHWLVNRDCHVFEHHTLLETNNVAPESRPNNDLPTTWFSGASGYFQGEWTPIQTIFEGIIFHPLV